MKIPFTAICLSLFVQSVFSRPQITTTTELDLSFFDDLGPYSTEESPELTVPPKKKFSAYVFTPVHKLANPRSTVAQPRQDYPSQSYQPQTSSSNSQLQAPTSNQHFSPNYQKPAIATPYPPFLFQTLQSPKTSKSEVFPFSSVSFIPPPWTSNPYIPQNSFSSQLLPAPLTNLLQSPYSFPSVILNPLSIHLPPGTIFSSSVPSYSPPLPTVYFQNLGQSQVSNPNSPVPIVATFVRSYVAPNQQVSFQYPSQSITPFLSPLSQIPSVASPSNSHSSRVSNLPVSSAPFVPYSYPSQTLDSSQPLTSRQKEYLTSPLISIPYNQPFLPNQIAWHTYSN